MGYSRAGFEVVGVDIAPQPNFPFEFVQDDALEYAERHLSEFNAVHASPPCQEYSKSLRSLRRNSSIHYDKLLEATREILALHPCRVIENVPGATIPDSPALWGDPGVMLCGTMFDLGVETPNGWREVRRHRLFESSLSIFAPQCRHRFPVINPYNAKARKRDGIEHFSDKWYARAMGVEWESRRFQTREAIPPAYTEWIGAQLLQHIQAECLV
jgi:DNA (cytosine-5)-methyltransferase 1